MKLGWFHYHMPMADPVARGFFTTAFHLYQGFSDVEKQVGMSEKPKWFPRPDGTTEPVQIIDIGTKTYMKDHLKKAGLDMVFHFCPPHRFLPIPWTRNILFTMWEAPILPRAVNYGGEAFDLKARLSQADTIIVPSTFVQNTFMSSFNLKTTVVPLGVGPEFLALEPQRQLLRGPGTPRLRFLYVGTNNPRKGYQLIPHAWKEAFEGTDAAIHTQLYMKGIHPEEAKRDVMVPYPDQRVIIDRRDLGPEDLAQIYQAADVFVFPSFGEGFGLPPLEAMASGCLVASTTAGGLADFISHRVARVITRPVTQRMNYGEEFEAEIPTVGSVAQALRDCYDHWGKAPVESLRQRGVKAARTMTWDNTVNSVARIILARFLEESHEEQGEIHRTPARIG